MRTMQLAPRTSSVPAFIRLRLSERHNGVMKSSLSMFVHMLPLARTDLYEARELVARENMGKGEAISRLE